MSETGFGIDLLAALWGAALSSDGWPLWVGLAGCVVGGAVLAVVTR